MFKSMRMGETEFRRPHVDRLGLDSSGVIHY